jgi:glucose/mannose-6-phosphate isomerase
MPRTTARRATPPVDLDKRDSYQHLDPFDILGIAVDFPAQVEEAAQVGRAFCPPDTLRNPAQIVLAGMGGSAVSGDLLSRLTEHTLPVPFLVCRDYAVPAFVGPNTLFIVSSFSGNTEETISAAQHALKKKARVVCITGNGEIAALARRRKLPLITIPRHNPNMPPRSALGYSLIPLVMMFESLGLYPGASRDLKETLAVLRQQCQELGPDVPTRRNLAKQLAKALFMKIPVIQGTVGVMSAAAYRWRTQLNENSNMIAISSEYSELNHNEVVGWELQKELGRQLEVVTLTRPGDHPHIKARVEITQAMAARKARVHLVEAQGKSLLAQTLWATGLGDFMSIYLAYLNGADPAAIKNIIELKQRLKEKFG